MATITIYVPDQDPIELALDGYEQVSIGRGPDNDIVLDHVSMSGTHAMIHNVGGNFQVQDLGSTNGTYVNGSAVTEAALANGYRIQFGSVEAVFHDETEAGSDFGASSGGSGFTSGHVAEIAEVSNRPSGYADLSPIEKVVKKNPLGQIATLVGVVAILAAIALIALSAIMKAG
ncbi:MAG: FHA domain-containing protein [Verrucomicrobiae bacterium]|nr:FHA domain-containing protein [Verrucomicrobiae bacterium]